MVDFTPNNSVGSETALWTTIFNSWDAAAQQRWVNKQGREAVDRANRRSAEAGAAGLHRARDAASIGASREEDWAGFGPVLREPVGPPQGSDDGSIGAGGGSEPSAGLAVPAPVERQRGNLGRGGTARAAPGAAPYGSNVEGVAWGALQPRERELIESFVAQNGGTRQTIRGGMPVLVRGGGHFGVFARGSETVVVLPNDVNADALRSEGVDLQPVSRTDESTTYRIRRIVPAGPEGRVIGAIVGATDRSAPDADNASAPAPTTTPTTAPVTAEDLQTRGFFSRNGIVLNSGARSPDRNEAVGGVPDSLHLQGTAVDVRLPQGMTPEQFRSLLEAEIRQPVEDVIPYRDGHVHAEWRAGGEAGESDSAPPLMAGLNIGTPPRDPYARVGALEDASGPLQASRELLRAASMADGFREQAEIAYRYGDIADAERYMTAYYGAITAADAAEQEQLLAAAVYNNNFDALQQFMEDFMGQPEGSVAIQPTQDGRFNILINGARVTDAPMSLRDFGRSARAAISAEYAAQIAEQQIEYQVELLRQQGNLQIELIQQDTILRQELLRQTGESGRAVLDARTRAAIAQGNVQFYRDGDGRVYAAYLGEDGQVQFRNIGVANVESPTTGGRRENIDQFRVINPGEEVP